MHLLNFSLINLKRLSAKRHGELPFSVLKPAPASAYQTGPHRMIHERLNTVSRFADIQPTELEQKGNVLTFSWLGRVCVLEKVSPPLILISSASAGGNGVGKTTTSLFSVSELKQTSYCCVDLE